MALLGIIISALTAIVVALIARNGRAPKAGLEEQSRYTAWLVEAVTACWEREVERARLEGRDPPPPLPPLPAPSTKRPRRPRPRRA